MLRIRRKIDEFCSVIDSCPDLEYAIAAAFSLPCLIFALGTWIVTSLDPSGPFGPFMSAIEEPLEMFFAVIAAITFTRLMDAVIERYRQASSVTRQGWRDPAIEILQRANARGRE